MLRFKEINGWNNNKELCMEAPELKRRWLTGCGHIIRDEDHKTAQYLNCSTGNCK